MIDQAKLQDVLRCYKRDFVSFIWNDKDYKRWNDEKFKWEAVKCFQEHWNVNAEDFAEMLKNALSRTSKLLVSVNNFPRGMIEGFAKSAPEEVRAMFIDLYDEGKDVYERINAFKLQSAVMLKKYGGDAKQHYQYENAICTYLWLRYPDKYYIYKYSILQKVSEILASDYHFKQGAYADNIRNFLRMYDEISAALKEDTELVDLFKANLTDSCYDDPELKTLTVDFCFYIANFYEDRIKQENDSSEEYKIVEEEKIITDALNSDSFDTIANAWLLAWNPKNYDWENVEEEFSLDTMFKRTGSGGGYYDQWRCMSSKIKCGDLLYVMKLGSKPKGIFVFGYAISDSTVVDGTRVVDVLFTKAIDFRTADIISQQTLKERFPEQQWSPQGAGISIKPEAVRWLIRHWNDYIVENESYDETAIDEPAAVEPYTKQDFLSEVYMTEERYNALTGVLQNKLNIILQGAPGVGKTFAARRLAWSIMDEKDDSRIEFVQFHQNYSYEDFMMGYKPAGDSFELKYGIFYRFCQKAQNQPDKPFFFIIDEINRGNMSKIFGELLMLIEKDYRDTKATLAYNGMPFSVPKNLYIIGMMNTADRSLAMIDYALRRRFSFFDIEPGFDSQGFLAYQNSLNNDTLNELISRVKDLNNEIALDKSLGKGFCIGHSYFCGRTNCTEEWLRAVVDYDILPMLREYWFDETNKLQRWENILQGVFQS